MKNLFILFTALIFSAQISAQCICEITFTETSDCCYQMYYTLSNDNSGIICTSTGFNRITINTNWIPAQSSEVVSVSMANANLTASVNAANNIVTINSPVPLVSPPSLGVPILLGTICLANGPQPPLDASFRVSFSNSAIPAVDPCDYSFTKNLACGIPGEWTSLCGDNSAHAKLVNSIHAFNDGVYVAGFKEILNGAKYATFSKYNITDGSLIWQKEMGIPSVFSDFAYIPSEDAFICVGRTDPIQAANGTAIDNKSILAKFDDQGNMVASKIYDQVGKEEFTHILRHTNPPNPSFPFYVLGSRNPDAGPNFPPPPSQWDIPMIFNINANLGINWTRRYDTFFFNNEYEITKGFFQFGQNLIMTGNDVLDHDGVLMTVDVANPIPILGFGKEFTSSDFELYEGLELPNGQIVVAGTNTATNEAVLIVLNNFYNPLYGLSYPDIKEFREIGLDASGRIYTVGPLKDGSDFNVINRIVNTGTALQHDISAYFDEGGTPLPLGHFEVTPALDAVFYADGIKGSPNSSFGVFGMTVTSLGLDLNDACMVAYPQSPVSFNSNYFSFENMVTTVPEPAFVPATSVNNLPFSCNTPCIGCETISLGEVQACNGASVQIPLMGCSNLSDIIQVNWYVAPAPCPPGSWGDPFQVTNNPASFCDALELYTQGFSGNVCVYAEIIRNSNAAPCTILTTNVITVALCEPVECSISGGQEYCYTGSPIVPGPLTLNINSSSTTCTYTVQWYNANGPISGATGLTYQPPALGFLGSSSDCYFDHVFTAQISGPCGTSSCSTTFRLFNNNAPVGTLVMDPIEAMPFCPGEDATLRYTPECAGDTPMWEWWISTNGTTYSPLSDAGNMNPLYNTNKLYADTWYRIQKQVGGGCPVDVVDLMIDVKTPLTITSFTAQFSPICSTDEVDMTVHFAPCTAGGICNCNYTVEWYKDTTLLHSNTYTSSPVIYTHTDLPDKMPGNYYVIIKDNCCDGQVVKSIVVNVPKPWDVLVAGPCFLCGPGQRQLEVVFLNQQPSGCTYQWTTPDGNIVGSANGATVIVDKAGAYTIEATCGPCSKQADITLIQCIVVATNEVWSPNLDWTLSPNPTDGDLKIEIFSKDLTGPYEIRTMNALGNEVLPRKMLTGTKEAMMEMEKLPSGVYYLSLHYESVIVARAKIVKQ